MLATPPREFGRLWRWLSSELVVRGFRPENAATPTAAKHDRRGLADEVRAGARISNPACPRAVSPRANRAAFGAGIPRLFLSVPLLAGRIHGADTLAGARVVVDGRAAGHA